MTTNPTSICRLRRAGILRAAIVWSALSNFAVAAEHVVDSAHIQARTDMISAIEQVRMLDEDALRTRLHRDRPNLTPIAQLWSRSAPQYWVGDAACKSAMKANWVALNLCEPDADIIFGHTPDIPAEEAQDTLLDVVAFDEACARTNAVAWEILLARASQSAALLDLCLVGRAMWGADFEMMPSSRTRVMDPEQANGPAALQGGLPVPTQEQWQAMATASNGVYRLLAIRGMRGWGVEPTPPMIRSALDDTFIAVRRKAMSLLRSIPEDRQVDVLAAVRAACLDRQETDEYAAEIEKEFSADVGRVLKRSKKRLKSGRVSE